MSTFAPCADCPGTIIVGKFDTITVPRVDEDGFPELDLDGRVQTIRLKLPQHRARLVSQGPSAVVGFEPNSRTPILLGGDAAPEGKHSVFDPTGFSMSMCTHGLPDHPAGYRLSRGGQSWMRAKYIGWDFLCVVCHGAEAPADFTTPRNA